MSKEELKILEGAIKDSKNKITNMELVQALEHLLQEYKLTDEKNMSAFLQIY